MDRVEGKFIWGFRPELTEVFIGREPFEGLESSGEVVGPGEVIQVRFELALGVVEVAFHRSVLDGPVHALDLPVGPRVVGLGEPVFDVMNETEPEDASVSRGQRIRLFASQKCSRNSAVNSSKTNSYCARNSSLRSLVFSPGI